MFEHYWELTYHIIEKKKSYIENLCKGIKNEEDRALLFKVLAYDDRVYPSGTYSHLSVTIGYKSLARVNSALKIWD